MADRSGCIMVNDQIIEVDSTPLLGKSNQEAVELLKNTDARVQLTIVRYLRGLKFEELRQGISQANVVTPTAPYAQTPLSEVARTFDDSRVSEDTETNLWRKEENQLLLLIVRACKERGKLRMACKTEEEKE